MSGASEKDAAAYKAGEAVATPGKAGERAPADTVGAAQKAAAAAASATRNTAQKRAQDADLLSQANKEQRTVRFAALPRGEGQEEAGEQMDVSLGNEERPKEAQTNAVRPETEGEEAAALPEDAPASADLPLQEDPDDGAPPAASGKSARIPRKKPVYAWLRVTRPPAAAGKIKAQRVHDALKLGIMDFTDDTRDGGALEGIPPKFVAADADRDDGPWWYACATMAEATAFMMANGDLLMVDNEDGGGTGCRVAIDTKTKDDQAFAIADEEGYWLEIYIGKDGALNSVDIAADIVVDQMKVMVTQSKFPRAKDGLPTNKTKICLKAIPINGVEVEHPMTLKVTVGKYTTPLRYRVQEGFFPGRCARCHRLESGCACDSIKANNAAQRERRMNYKMDRKAAKDRKATERGAPSGTLKDPAERLRERRVFTKMSTKAVEQGKCRFYIMGTCHFGDNCRGGKHEVSTRQPNTRHTS
jgi:hypothetical protein